MSDIFLKHYLPEDNTLFFFHFRNGEAIRQIEISPSGKVFLSIGNPIEGDSFLFDQDYDPLDVEEARLITESEFEKAWSER